jgi:hypothetical protein
MHTWCFGEVNLLSAGAVPEEKISKFFVSYVETSRQDKKVVKEVMVFIKD